MLTRRLPSTGTKRPPRRKALRKCGKPTRSAPPYYPPPGTPGPGEDPAGEATSAPLSPRAVRFCQEYPCDLNGTQAAIRAGYSPNGADAAASRLLRDVRVKALVQRKMEAWGRAVDLRQDKTLRALGALTNFDPLDLVDPMTGEPRQLHEIPPHARACIEGIGWKDGRPKFRLTPRVPALTLTMKHQKLLADRREHNFTDLDTGSMTREQILEALKKIAAAEFAGPSGSKRGSTSARSIREPSSTPGSRATGRSWSRRAG